tara:strand:+ start:3594 stop:3839 length:246 start_codon:yes stop_codon:yes gene_type:complete
MGSYVKKKRRLEKDDWGYVFGNTENTYHGYMSHRINLQIEYFTNDEMDCLVKNDRGMHTERSIGVNKIKYKFNSKDRFNDE